MQSVYYINVETVIVTNKSQTHKCSEKNVILYTSVYKSLITI